MTQLANEASSTADSNLLTSHAAAKAAQRWLSYVTPVVNRVTGAVVDTQSVIEKRLGFCPGKELLKATSKGLEALADGLHLVAKRLRAFAEAAPVAVEASGSSEPQAQA